MSEAAIALRPAACSPTRVGRHRFVAITAVVTIGLLALAGCRTPTDPPAGGGSGRYRSQVFSSVEQTSNIEYSRAPGRGGATQVLRLDVFQPRGDTAAKRPLIVLAYAGAFIFGSKDNTADPAYEMSQYYARRGYVTAMINYRMLASGLCTGIGSSSSCRNAAIAGIFDGLAAVRYLRANADRYRIDPDRIAFGGDSAGGVMAAGVGVMSQITVDQMPEGQANKSTPDTSGRVQAFMSLSGGLPEAEYINAGDAPGILFTGTADTIVPSSHSRIVADGLRAAGIDSKLVTFPGAGHVPWNHRSEILTQTTDWFYQHLDLANATP